MANLRPMKVLAGVFALLCSLFRGFRPTRSTGRRVAHAALATLTMATSLVVLQRVASAAGDLDITVDKSHAVEPSAEGDAVEFTVAITNNETVHTVTIDSVVDNRAPGDGSVCDGSPGTALTGTTIAPGATVNCAYTLADYAPPAGESKTNEVTVNVSAIVPGGGSPGPDAYFVYSENNVDNTADFLIFDDPNDTDNDDFTTETFTGCDVNDNIDFAGCLEPLRYERHPLRYFSENPGQHIGLLTGGKSKEAIHQITEATSEQSGVDWDDPSVGPTTDGFKNFFGNPDDDGHDDFHDVGCGLGVGKDENPDDCDDPEAHLDKVPTEVFGIQGFYSSGDGLANVNDLLTLVGKQVCLLVKDDDVSLDLPKGLGNYKGDYNGFAAIEIIKFDPTWSQSPYDVGDWNTAIGESSGSFFPAMRVKILDQSVCGTPPPQTILGSGSDTDTVTTPALPPVITLDIVKTNDADVDGTFTDSEVADAEGQAVEFLVDITNTSAVPVVITSLTDLWPGQASFSPTCLDSAAADVIGQTLAAGASTSCTFTVADYAPPAGEDLIDTVTVIVADVDDDTNTATDMDNSTVSTPEPPPVITLDIVKTNDADVDGTFTDSEVADAEGEAVEFLVDITNTSAVPVVITSLTDLWPGQASFSPTCLDSAAADVIGQTLAAGASTSCTFTVADYAPPAGEDLIDTVTVIVADVNDDTNTATDMDDSTVSTPEPEPPVITLDIVKTNDADVDGTFTDSEVADAEGQAVEFLVDITNTSAVPVVITSLTDCGRGRRRSRRPVSTRPPLTSSARPWLRGRARSARSPWPITPRLPVRT